MKRAPRLLLLLALGGVTSSHASVASAEDNARADALFREGTARRRANQLDEACALFEESHRLDPAGGTTFAWADCLEAQGKLAQATARYREAGAIARQRRNAEKERLVAERLAAIEPRLPTLVVEVPAAWRRLPGLVVTRDDRELGAPAFGVAVPVDPGPHVVRLSAEGVAPFTTTIDSTEGTRSVVDAGPPHELPVSPRAGEIGRGGSAGTATEAPTATVAPRAVAPTASRPRQIVAGSLGVVGLAVAAVSVGSFVGSRNKVAEAAPSCPDGCDARGHALYERARTQHFVGVAFGASAALLLAGAGILAFTDLGRSSPTLTLSPQRLSLGYETTF